MTITYETAQGVLEQERAEFRKRIAKLEGEVSILRGAGDAIRELVHERDAERARAERLAEALRQIIAERHNEHPKQSYADEIERTAREALAETEQGR